MAPPEYFAPLMRFIAEQSKDVKWPMSLPKWSRKFIEETGFNMSAESLQARLWIYRADIHKMNDFNMDTKVRMMFALSAPVDREYLVELRKYADVTVDDEQRIIMYKKKNGGLELSGSHENHWQNNWKTVCQKLHDDADDQTVDNEMRMKMDLVRFLVEKTKNATSQLDMYELVKEFQSKYNCTDKPSLVRDRIRRFRTCLHHIDHFDTPTMIRTLFALSAPMNEDFLTKIRNDATVVIDKKKRITKYEANDGTLKLEGEYTRPMVKERFWKINSQVMKPGAKIGGSSNQPLPPSTSNQAPTSTTRGSGVTGTRKRVLVPYSSSEESQNGHSIVGKEEEDEKSRQGDVEEDEMKEDEDDMSDQPSTDYKSILNHLRNSVLAMESPELDGLLKKIDDEIAKLGRRNQQIPIATVNNQMEQCLRTLRNNATLNSPANDNSKNLRDVLISLKTATAHIAMKSYHQKLKTAIQELDVQNKSIAVVVICRAMETLIGTIAPS